MFDNFLESSHQDNSNKWSKIGFGEVIMQAVSIEVGLQKISVLSNSCNKFDNIQTLIQYRSM